MDPEELPQIPDEADETGEGVMPSALPQPLAPGEQAVPLSALAQPDDAEELQTPKPGDSASMTVDYTVVRIEGEKAIVKATAINGKPLEDEAAEPMPEVDTEGADLRAMAEQAGM